MRALHIPKIKYVFNLQTTITGWGYTRYDPRVPERREDSPDQLQEAALKTVTRKTCANAWPHLRGHSHVLCAGGDDSRGSCLVCQKAHIITTFLQFPAS